MLAYLKVLRGRPMKCRSCGSSTRRNGESAWRAWKSCLARAVRAGKTIWDIFARLRKPPGNCSTAALGRSFGVPRASRPFQRGL